MRTKRFLSGLIVGAMALMSVTTMAEVKGYEVIVNGEQKEQLQALPSQNQVDLIPFKKTIEQLGGTHFTWKASKSEGTKGSIEFELSTDFKAAQLCNLNQSLLREEIANQVPEAVKALLTKETDEKAGTLKDQNRGIEITINDEGYQREYMIYQYEMINGTLYVPLQVFKDLSLNQVSINQQNKTLEIKVPTEAELNTKIEAIETALQSKESEVVLKLWNSAQQIRSGALQYALLNDSLKEKVLPEVKERGWVTGGSSPTLNGGKITVLNKEEVSADKVKYTVQYESMVEEKPYETLKQEVTLTKNSEGYWKISGVTGDTSYFTYSF